MTATRIFFACFVLVSSSSAAVATIQWQDCEGDAETVKGRYGVQLFQNQSTADNHTLYVLTPSSSGHFPVLAFMHGSTGQFEMYKDVLELYASHGFVVLFPFIKSPSADKSPFTTNTNGIFITRALAYAAQANADANSPLYQRIDISNGIIAGHSMGATCSIAAGRRFAESGGDVHVRAVVTQHPGVCGPFGPPPLPSTWMPEDLFELGSKLPVLMTTAVNDAAFWPQPLTAKHELGCFMKSREREGAFPNGAAFASFTADACSEDHAHDPFTDSGHNCPFKTGVEAPWVLRVMKLYAQFGGSQDSACFNMVWNGGIQNATTISTSEVVMPL